MTTRSNFQGIISQLIVICLVLSCPNVAPIFRSSSLMHEIAMAYIMLVKKTPRLNVFSE